MHHVALAIKHDIAIVSVLDLQDVTKQRVACHALQERILCLSVLPPVYFVSLDSISLYEVLPQTYKIRISFLKLIN